MHGFLMGLSAISILMPHTWHDPRDKIPRQHVVVISIHMPHTWHDSGVQDLKVMVDEISIHMPHTWHDRCRPALHQQGLYFNPHATYVA